MTTVGVDVIGTATTLASNTSLLSSDVSRLRCTRKGLSLRHACARWPSRGDASVFPPLPLPRQEVRRNGLMTPSPSCAVGFALSVAARA
jgi:hypothetical protein